MSDPVFDLSALAATPVSMAPFPHVVVPDFVPPASLAAVYADMPKRGRGGSFPPEALRLGPHARALTQQMQGPELRACIAEKFVLELEDAPTMLTVRLASRTSDGRIHTDSTAKQVTVLLYLNPPEGFESHKGCLRLLRRPDDLEDFAVEVPPIRGTLLVFPNDKTAWHGHHTFIGPRYVIQMNYMTHGEKARSEMRRHRMSALLKRFMLPPLPNWGGASRA
jgi:hypothetical protein